MASLHEIQYKAWLVYESNEDAVHDLQANDTPWHYQSKDHTSSKPHRIKVNWSNKESNASEDTGFTLMSKCPELADEVNPDPKYIRIYDWQGYDKDDEHE